MRRSEAKFVSADAAQVAAQLGAAIRAARLARNATQENMAERGRMSPLTWLRIEKGDVSVAMGTWLSALEQTGLLSKLGNAADPSNDPVGEQLRQARMRVRARPDAASNEDYDF
jgi:transcriptional regulator with XRE-family HTH domain